MRSNVTTLVTSGTGEAGAVEHIGDRCTVSSSRDTAECRPGARAAPLLAGVATAGSPSRARVQVAYRRTGLRFRKRAYTPSECERTREEHAPLSLSVSLSSYLNESEKKRSDRRLYAVVRTCRVYRSIPRVVSST